MSKKIKINVYTLCCILISYILNHYHMTNPNIHFPLGVWRAGQIILLTTVQNLKVPPLQSQHPNEALVALIDGIGGIGGCMTEPMAHGILRHLESKCLGIGANLILTWMVRIFYFIWGWWLPCLILNIEFFQATQKHSRNVCMSICQESMGLSQKHKDYSLAERCHSHQLRAGQKPL